ncbi:hypothetical protein IC1_01172 [Bacillus cereus VD022]|uniref:Phage protein n=1 Tax=Bacillus cereus TIAC219 TaxID=718222 RepID=A0ABC9T3P6_BACCE|nr:hypothetical protein IC1_01172 [Bacillus cereus VD022]EOQ69796.1 hypothetical protein IAY_02927 [Bacillus cereus TIAC219]
MAQKSFDWFCLSGVLKETVKDKKQKSMIVDNNDGI